MVDQRKVFVHIGAPKTGTTFVQRLLWGNREALAREGIALPGSSRGEHMRAGYDLRTVPAAPADPKRPMPQWEGTWDRLAEATRTCDQNVAVISEERLAGASAEDAALAVASLAPAEVHVVYTAREWVGLLPAAWQEYVKNRSTQTFEEWLADVFDRGGKSEGGAWFWLVQDAADVLRRWGKSVPAERIHVVPVLSAGAPVELLWRRLASLLRVDPDCVDLSAVRTNASLSLEQTEFLRRVNATLGPDFPEWHYMGFVREVFAREILPSRAAKGRRPVRPAVPAERAAQAGAVAERIITDLAQAGYDVVGDLAELRPALRSRAPGDDAGQVARPPAAIDVLDASVDAVAGLLVHVGDMRDQRREMDQRLARARDELRATRVQRDRALQQLRRSEQRPPRRIAKDAFVDLAGSTRTFAWLYRAYKATRRAIPRR